MVAQNPTGTSLGVRHAFSKVFVHDLDKMAAFYQEVFGLIPYRRHTDMLFGRAIEEITFLATHDGANALELISYLDSTAPLAGESVQGFITDDLDALLERALAAEGRAPGPVKRFEDMKLSVTFILDPEGHINEVVQIDRA